MKYHIFTIGLAAALFAACSVNEMDINTPINENEEFFATIEDASSRVYVDDDLMVLWHADDRVSIFNKYTFNQEYRFTGETGTNSGSFNKVPNDDFITGNALNYVYAVYPYQESTAISNQGVLSINLPATQTYAENTFGIGANTMVSCSEGNELLFKNLCGYLMLKLYGDNVSVKSISLKGNNNESLAGLATVNASVNTVPTFSFDSSATKEITLTFDSPVTLGSTPETATVFWLVVPPTTFSKGFTMMVKDNKNGVFEKSTTKSLEIRRNTLSRMTALEVQIKSTKPNNVIIYTSTDGRIVNPSNIEVFERKLVSNDYAEGIGKMVFDGDVTIIGNSAFSYCSRLKTIELPTSVETIDHYAFQNCTALTDVNLPENLTRIGQSAFNRCTGLYSIVLPEGLTQIGDSAFSGCSSLCSVTIPNSLTEISGYLFSSCTSLSSINLPETITSIWDSAFRNCTSLSSINLPGGLTEISNFTFSNCTNLTDIRIPNGVTRIGSDAFSYCTGLTGNLTIPSEVTSIGATAFRNCTGLTSITVLPTNPPQIGSNAFYNFLGTILVPVDSVIAYKNAEGWSVYSNRISGIGTSYIYYTSTDGSIVYPNNEYVFGDCSIISNTYANGMGVITIAGVLTTIDSMAFFGQTNLKSISIPESVTYVGAYSFYDCSNLERIDVKPIIPPAGGEKMFTNTGLGHIYIPAGSEDAYVNADYWADYALRMRVEGSDSSLAYCSSDYSQDGKVLLLQQSTIGRGINIILMGDGFLDKDMEPGGKYEQRMREVMEQFFVYEPYRSFRNRFNIYAVKVVSKNSIYRDEESDRRLTYDQGNSIVFRTELSTEYGEIVPNPYNQPLKICTVCNTKELVGRSFCSINTTGWASCIIYEANGNVINHELGGHGFGFLWDEYEEKTGTFTEKDRLDEQYINYGWGGNVDWRSNPNEVRWANLLKDPRYSQEGLGVFEGAYLYSYGIYRPSENSMMRHHDSPFNAPSREQIYKNIMKYSEGDSWQYDYEEFVKADESGRNQVISALNSANYAPQRNRQKGGIVISDKDIHIPPVILDQPVREICVDQNGSVTLIP